MLTTANNISINYEITGPEDGPVLVFSNSLATSLEMWNGQVDHLKDEYRILRYDNRGHGGTPVPDMELSLIHISEPTRRYAIGYAGVWV